MTWSPDLTSRSRGTSSYELKLGVITFPVKFRAKLQFKVSLPGVAIYTMTSHEIFQQDLARKLTLCDLTSRDVFAYGDVTISASVSGVTLTPRDFHFPSE